jgi:hypothetical protein
MTALQRLGLAGLLALAVAAGSPAQAQSLGVEAHVGSPQVDYSADMTMEGQGHVMHGRVFRSGDKERREIRTQGQDMVMIVRLDTRTVYMGMPQLQSPRSTAWTIPCSREW